MGESKYSIVYLKCCRVWPIVLGHSVGRCGLCGKRPREIVDGPDISDYVSD